VEGHVLHLGDAGHTTRAARHSFCEEAAARATTPLPGERFDHDAPIDVYPDDLDGHTGTQLGVQTTVVAMGRPGGDGPQECLSNGCLVQA
jgi:hypothetical protein